MQKTTVLITGAGGFIGHHLAKYLVQKDYWVRGVDVKDPEYEPTPAHEFQLLDLRRWDNCLTATRGIDEVYALAANMGGIGFIETNKSCATTPSSTLILLRPRKSTASSVFSIPRAPWVYRHLWNCGVLSQSEGSIGNSSPH